MYKAIQKIILLLALVFFAAGCSNQNTHVSPSAQHQYNYTHKLQAGNQTLAVEIANDSQKMQQGLSGRESMSDNQGMLFDFGNQASATPAFWMKDMKFDLDFIWIQNKKIVGITANVPAPIENWKLETPTLRSELRPIGVGVGNLPKYYPPSPVDRVLEVNAGWAERNNVKVGDEVNLK